MILRNEAQAVLSGANCSHSETGGNGNAGRRADPAGWDQRTDVLSLEEAIPGLESDQVRQLKQLQDENGRLKKLVAELTLDRAMLQDVLRKNW
jgi:putative transposase